MEAGEIIALIKALGGGSSLPPVTASDNGKVLAVKDGDWAAQANDVVLNATPTWQDGYWTIAITSQLPSASDLEAWFNENRHIVLHFSNDAWYARLYAAEKDISNGSTYYSFTGYGVNFDGDKIRYLVKFNVSGSTVSCVASAYIDGKFIVTLTPTALDYSGTMDKTPAEITEAYVAGQEIEFDIPSMLVRCKAMEFALIVDTIQAGAIVTYRTGDSHLLIEILTDAADSTYYTHIYSLTPAS